MPIGRHPRMRPGAAAAVADIAVTPTPAVPAPGGAQAPLPPTTHWTRDFIVTPLPHGSRTLQLRARDAIADVSGLCTNGVIATRAFEASTGRVGIPEITKTHDNTTAVVTKPVGANWRRCVWLSDILANAAVRVPGQYVTWLMGRLIEACWAMHTRRVACNRLLPQTIAINQHDHQLLLCDWRSSAYLDVRRNSVGWSPAQLEALDVDDAPSFLLPYTCSPEQDVASLVGILTALIDHTDGSDAVWLSRQCAVLRAARRAQRGITQADFENWYTAATAAYGPRRRFNFVVDVPSTCFLA